MVILTMDIGNKVNWLITNRCNSNCEYCFSPKADVSYESRENILNIANKLSVENFDKVTLSGGEPLLIDGIEEIVQVLSSGDKYVSLHTNGYYLTEERVKKLRPYVGDIALSVDTMDPEINDRLRGKGSLDVFKNRLELLNKYNIKTGIHTVAMPNNIEKLDKVRDYISKIGFDYWKIYEKNNRPMGGDEISFSTDNDSGVNDFFGEFLIAEDKMEKDSRMKFIANEDRFPYLFLNNPGNISYHPWFTGDGKTFGNILETNFSKIIDNVNLFIGDDAEEFFDAKWELPLWARCITGEVDSEELRKIKPEYFDRFNELMELYQKRD